MHAAKSVHAATAEVIQRSKPTHALQRQEAHEHELPNSHVLRPMARLHIGGTRRFATSRYLAVKAGKDYPPGSHGWGRKGDGNNCTRASTRKALNIQTENRKRKRPQCVVNGANRCPKQQR